MEESDVGLKREWPSARIAGQSTKGNGTNPSIGHFSCFAEGSTTREGHVD